MPWHQRLIDRGDYLGDATRGAPLLLDLQVTERTMPDEAGDKPPRGNDEAGVDWWSAYRSSLQQCILFSDSGEQQLLRWAIQPIATT